LEHIKQHLPFLTGLHPGHSLPELFAIAVEEGCRDAFLLCLIHADLPADILYSLLKIEEALGKKINVRGHEEKHVVLLEVPILIWLTKENINDLEFAEVQTSLLMVKALLNKGRCANIDDLEQVVEALIVSVQVPVSPDHLQLLLTLFLNQKGDVIQA